MLTKFKITYTSGLETEVVSSDCHTVEALGMAMFGTESPRATIELIAERPAELEEPAKPAKK